MYHEEAVAQAQAEMTTDDVEDRLAALEKQEQVERMLQDLKAQRGK